MRTFHLLVANTLAASVTNNFLWFALTFWIYLETRSVVATAIVGGGYMLLAALSAMAFGTFVDRHLRATSMMLSSLVTLACFGAAAALYLVAPAEAVRDIGEPRVLGPDGAGARGARSPATCGRSPCPRP